MKEYSEDVKKQVKEIIEKYNESVKNGTATEGLNSVIQRIEEITGPLVDKNLIPENLDRFLTKEEIDNILGTRTSTKENVISGEKVDVDELISKIDEKLKQLED